MSSLTLRRSLVILATIASVFGGAVAIRAAAGWTASSPLTAPVNPATLVAKLQDEKARADAITVELSQVVERAAELQSALTAAKAKADADATAASGLAAQLAAAQTRLATLEKQLASPGTSPAAASPASAAAQPTEPEHGDDD